MAAIRLARAGASVTIFDASHPREKPCGGGVTGRALALIADVVDIASMPAVMVKAAIVEEPDTTDVMSAVTVRLPPSPGPRRTDTPTDLVVISREIFDKALLDAAVRSGAQLIAEKVTDISRLDRAWSVRTAHRAHAAELLLGADGAGGIVRKKVARPFLPSEISLAAGYFVHGISAPDIAIQSMTQQPGYLWSFPRPDHLAVGVCAPAGGSTTSNDLAGNRSRGFTVITTPAQDAASSPTPGRFPAPASTRQPDCASLGLDGCCWATRRASSIRSRAKAFTTRCSLVRGRQKRSPHAARAGPKPSTRTGFVMRSIPSSPERRA
jgi:glycine/D-amino acid oxidase-like deaminating enzyme